MTDFCRSSLKQGPVDSKTLAQAAACRWWADLLTRVSNASGHLVPSRLSESVKALPQEQQSDFLDSVGYLLMMEKSFGPHTGCQPAIDAGEYEIQFLAAGDQDAWYAARDTDEVSDEQQ